MIFPEIFITGRLPENPIRESLISDGLQGWACCMAGAKPPEKFGEGMALISTQIGQPATPDNLEKLADEIIAQKSA